MAKCSTLCRLEIRYKIYRFIGASVGATLISGIIMFSRLDFKRVGASARSWSFGPPHFGSHRKSINTGISRVMKFAFTALLN